MTVAAVEQEAIWLGDERVAEAIVRENDGLHNESEVVARAQAAEVAGDSAA